MRLISNPNLRILSHTPAWQLVVPYEIVASKDLVVCLGETGDDISLGPTESVLRRLSVNPFLCISWGYLTEIVEVLKDGHVLSI